MLKTIVTTSWDDGHQLNDKLAKLLSKYNLKATFYIAKQAEHPYSEAEIKELAKNYEIGSHTLTHPVLTEIDLDQAELEIKDSKIWLENLLNKSVKMFGYPYGLFNDKVKKLVEQTGYLGARTTEQLKLEPGDNFTMATTIHVYPYPFRKRDKDYYHLSRFLFEPLLRGLSAGIYLSWQQRARSLFKKAKKQNGVFHIFGHSWEIERYGMWAELEKLFQYISNQEDCLYLTNSQTLEQK